MKNIYLVGMMGSGKSSSCRELSRLLPLTFVDLDQLITEREGQSISDIFEKNGERYFRRLESTLLDEISKKHQQVVATGGGVVLDESNRDRMKQTGTVIYLKTGLDALWDRIKESLDRPLLRTAEPKQTLTDILRQRDSIYEEVSDHTLLTDGKSPNAVAFEIFKRWLKPS